MSKGLAKRRKSSIASVFFFPPGRMLRNTQIIHFLKFKSSVQINIRGLQEMLSLRHLARGLASVALWSLWSLPNGSSTSTYAIKTRCSVGLLS